MGRAAGRRARAARGARRVRGVHVRVRQHRVRRVVPAVRPSGGAAPRSQLFLCSLQRACGGSPSRARRVRRRKPACSADAGWRTIPSFIALKPSCASQGARAASHTPATRAPWAPRGPRPPASGPSPGSSAERCRVRARRPYSQVHLRRGAGPQLPLPAGAEHRARHGGCDTRRDPRVAPDQRRARQLPPRAGRRRPRAVPQPAHHLPSARQLGSGGVARRHPERGALPLAAAAYPRGCASAAAPAGARR